MEEQKRLKAITEADAGRMKAGEAARNAWTVSEAIQKARSAGIEPLSSETAKFFTV